MAINVDPTKESISVQLIRRDGHSIELGKVIQYLVSPFEFGVLIARDGIKIHGDGPNFAPENIDFLEKMIQRARIHCEHLASFPIGTTQTVLNEEEVTERLKYPRAQFNKPRLVQ